MTRVTLQPLDLRSLYAGRFRITGAPDARIGCDLYAAEDENGRRILLLVMAPELVADEISRMRLRDLLRAVPGTKGYATALVGFAVDETTAAGTWIALEAPWGGSLEQTLALGDLGPTKAGEALQSLCLSLKGLHLAGGFHGALSPAWLWYERSNSTIAIVTLVAPGVAAFISEQWLRGRDAGGPLVSEEEASWTPTELRTGGRASAATDVWSLAHIALRMLAGAHHWRYFQTDGAKDSNIVDEPAGGSQPAAIRPTETGNRASNNAAAHEAFRIAIETQGKFQVIRLSGRLDDDSSADFELAAHDLTSTMGVFHLVVDLAGVSYVSSAGLKVLRELAAQTSDYPGSSLRISGCSEELRDVYKLSESRQPKLMFPDVNSALRLPERFEAWFARCTSPEVALRPTLSDAADELIAMVGMSAQPAPAVRSHFPNEMILGNPKGSHYDRGLNTPLGRTGFWGLLFWAIILLWAIGFFIWPSLGR